MDDLRDVFGDRIVSSSMFPALPSNLNSCVLIMVLKVYMSDPHTAEELKENVWREVFLFPKNNVSA
jgi:hypothetical protein